MSKCHLRLFARGQRRLHDVLDRLSFLLFHSEVEAGSTELAIQRLLHGPESTSGAEINREAGSLKRGNARHRNSASRQPVIPQRFRGKPYRVSKIMTFIEDDIAFRSAEEVVGSSLDEPFHDGSINPEVALLPRENDF